MLIEISKCTTSCAVRLHVTRGSTFSNMHNTKLEWTEACSVGCMHALMHSHMHTLMYRQKNVIIFQSYLDISSWVEPVLSSRYMSCSRTQNSDFAKVFVFLCFVALRPKSTSMVMTGQPVHITTLFPGQA